MTAEALIALSDALKGDETPTPAMFRDAFDYPMQDMQYSGLPYDARRAYGGSRDAAANLYDVLMPSMKQFDVITDPTCLRVRVVGWPDGLSGGREIRGHGWHMDNEGRAKLMAIVRALLDWHHPEAVSEDEKANAESAFQDAQKPVPERKDEAVLTATSEWPEYTTHRPSVGTRFAWIAGDHCSSGMAMMTDEGPLDAEDMTNLDEMGADWWGGARWAPLPEGYWLAFEDYAGD